MSTGPSTVHTRIGEMLSIPDLAFGKILMLVTRLTLLEVFGSVETEKIENMFAALGRGIVGEETVGCRNRGFESAGHI
jgi:hypothetical protein